MCRGEGDLGRGAMEMGQAGVEPGARVGAGELVGVEDGQTWRAQRLMDCADLGLLVSLEAPEQRGL